MANVYLTPSQRANMDDLEHGDVDGCDYDVDEEDEENAHSERTERSDRSDRSDRIDNDRGRKRERSGDDNRDGHNAGRSYDHYNGRSYDHYNRRYNDGSRGRGGRRAYDRDRDENMNLNRSEMLMRADDESTSIVLELVTLQSAIQQDTGLRGRFNKQKWYNMYASRLDNVGKKTLESAEDLIVFFDNVLFKFLLQKKVEADEFEYAMTETILQMKEALQKRKLESKNMRCMRFVQDSMQKIIGQVRHDEKRLKRCG